MHAFQGVQASCSRKYSAHCQLAWLAFAVHIPRFASDNWCACLAKAAAAALDTCNMNDRPFTAVKAVALCCDDPVLVL